MVGKTFYEKAGTYKPTISLMKIEDGSRIVGGYTETDWVVNSNHKNGPGAFIFSVSNKEKYPLKANQTYSNYCHEQYIMCHVAGALCAADFLSNSGKGISSSMSSYIELNGKKAKTYQDVTGATHPFKTLEAELFHISYE